jgi:hypothetical protein
MSFFSYSVSKATKAVPQNLSVLPDVNYFSNASNSYSTSLTPLSSSSKVTPSGYDPVLWK